MEKNNKDPELDTAVKEIASLSSNEKEGLYIKGDKLNVTGKK